MCRHCRSTWSDFQKNKPAPGGQCPHCDAENAIFNPLPVAVIRSADSFLARISVIPFDDLLAESNDPSTVGVSEQMLGRDKSEDT